MEAYTPENYARKKNYYIEFLSVISGEVIKFPAMITDLQDKFTPNWTPEKVFGRMDPALTYNNTERNITAAFTVIGSDSEEAIDNITKLNKLINFLYPAYQRGNQSNTISAAPLMKIKFANLICNKDSDLDATVEDAGLVCGVTDFNHQYDFSGVTNFVDRHNLVVPMSFTINFSATVLHTHDLGNIGRQYPDPQQFPVSNGRANAEAEAIAAEIAAFGAPYVPRSISFAPAEELAEQPNAGGDTGLTREFFEGLDIPGRIAAIGTITE